MRSPHGDKNKENYAFQVGRHLSILKIMAKVATSIGSIYIIKIVLPFS